MKRVQVSLVVTAAALVFACVKSATKPTASTDFDARTGTIRSETLAHGHAIAGAATLAQIAALESQNLATVQFQLEAMAGDMGDMEQTCGMMAGSNLAGAVDRMSEECAEHAAAMTSAGSMGNAFDEESAHQDWMSAMLDSMASMHATMMSGSSCMGGMGGGGGMMGN